MAIVSIIICTYNGATSLPDTLTSLAGVCVPKGLSAELLVVDNGSTDRTAEAVHSGVLLGMPMRSLFEPRRGKSFAYNTGMSAAHGEVLLFTDDDVRLPENWIEGMCGPILSGKADAVTGGIRLAPRLERPWMNQSHRARLGSTEALNASSPGVMYGGNFSFARRVLDQVPYFDPELGPGQLGLCEELLFSEQLREAGFSLASAFDIAVEHCADESILLRSAFLERAHRQGRSDAYISYHWHHNTADKPRLRLLWMIVYLNYLRAKKPHEWLGRREGCAEWEISLSEGIAFYRQYLIERKRPRNYDRHGLRKIHS